MHDYRGRFWVRLKDAQMLAHFMQHKGLTIRQLAAMVGCSRSLIGHLHSGERSTCRPATARKIERCLGAPPGLLFDPRVSNVQHGAGHAA